MGKFLKVHVAGVANSDAYTSQALNVKEQGGPVPH